MAETATNLVEHVLPTEARLRQFVLTLPFELRARLAYDGVLLGAVCQAFIDSVLGWYQRLFGARGLDRGKSGAVTVAQRVSSDLRLNPHFHTLVLDGVYVADEHGKVVFHPLPCLTSSDVANILQIACSTCTAKDEPVQDKPRTHRSGYRPWRELLMRSFKIDVEHCRNCGGRMKLRALVVTAASIERYLRWIGEPVDPPVLAPARDPRPALLQKPRDPLTAC